MDEMKGDEMKGKIIEIQSIHKVPLKNLGLPKRWVVWGITVMDKLDSNRPWSLSQIARVWLCTVTDNNDTLPLRLKSLLVKNFFETLVSKKIEFSEKYEEWRQSCYSVDESTLPRLFRVNSFSDIYGWLQKNRPKYLKKNSRCF